MKNVTTVGLSTLILFCLSNVVGCSGTSPGADPVYAKTDAPTQSIPRVRTEYHGTRVASIPYLNKTLAEYSYLGDAAVGILPEYLLEAGFQPVEAAQGAELNKVLSELKYGQSENVDPATAAQVGKQLGTQYTFLGEVNSYRVVKDKGRRSGGGRIPMVDIPIGVNFGSGGITYDLQVSGRLVSVETRAILASKTLAHNQTFKFKGGGLSTPWGHFSQGQEIEIEKEVGGKVLGVALNRLVADIVEQLNRRPPPKTTSGTTAVPSVQPAAQPGSKFCANCGAALAAGAKFCANCGKKISQE